MLETMRKIPILLPIYYLTYGLYSMCLMWRDCIRWLLGFWKCDDCRSEFSYKHDKKEEYAHGYDGPWLIATRCEKCNDERTVKNGRK